MTEAEKVAQALGGKRAGAGFIAYCPAHDNTNSPALSVASGRGNRLLVKCHAGCDPTSILRVLRERGIVQGPLPNGPIADEVQDSEAFKIEEARQREKLKYAQSLFENGQECVGTPVQRYLEARGLSGLKFAGLRNSLRFQPSCRHSGSGLNLPAMIAQIRGPNGEAMGVHRTYLRPDGSSKADVTPTKVMLGPSAGGTVHFGPARPVLALAEGIETALSFGLSSGATTWATLSTSGMKGVTLPPAPAAQFVIIAADNDAAGLASATTAATRLRAEGRVVEIMHPTESGKDFNDVLRRKEIA